MAVPLLDLRRQYAALASELDSRVRAVIASQVLVVGTVVVECEIVVVEYLSIVFAVGVASDTDDLLTPLRNLELEEGDEVKSVLFTFFATAGVIHNAGGIP